MTQYLSSVWRNSQPLSPRTLLLPNPLSLILLGFQLYTLELFSLFFVLFLFPISFFYTQSLIFNIFFYFYYSLLILLSAVFIHCYSMHWALNFHCILSSRIFEWFIPQILNLSFHWIYQYIMVIWKFITDNSIIWILSGLFILYIFSLNFLSHYFIFYTLGYFC